MISLVTGVLGSGKTYLVINEIYKNIKEHKSQIYTNIPLNALEEQVHFLDIEDLRRVSGKELELSYFYEKQVKLFLLYEEYLKNEKELDCKTKRILRDEYNFDEEKLKEDDFIFEDPRKKKYLEHSLFTYVNDDLNRTIKLI